MIATITEVTQVERENQPSYFIMKANAVQGDANASALDDEGFINPLACMSRSFNLTKCAFPATEEQEAALKVQLVEGVKVRLGLFQIPVGKKFNIYGKDGNMIVDKKTTVTTKVNNTGKPISINGKLIPVGKEYDVEEEIETPRIYENVSLVLFVDKSENSLEGVPEEIAHRNFASGLANGTYQLVD